MSWKKFLSGVLIGTFVLGVSVADLNFANAKSNDKAEIKSEQQNKNQPPHKSGEKNNPPQQMKDGKNQPPEPPKDSDGKPLPPPDKNFDNQNKK